jgi:hypothetical protein
MKGNIKTINTDQKELGEEIGTLCFYTHLNVLEETVLIDRHG